MVLFCEWRHLRTVDELSARSRALDEDQFGAALFAVGVITSRILRFRFGLCCRSSPRPRSVFGLGFASRRLLLHESIFIGIYLYGWDRLSPRAHFLSGIPIAIAGSPL